MIGCDLRAIRTLAALAVAALILSGCLGNQPVIGPDPAAIEAAKARGGQAIDPTHVDAGELLAIESGALDRSAPQQPQPQTAPPAYTPSAHEAAAPSVETQQTRKTAGVQTRKRTLKKPKAKANEIVAVAVPPVKGAPGDGNAELTEAMRDVLEGAGWPVETKPGPNALTVAGKVEVGRDYQGKQPVRLAWTVSDPSGNVLGTIRQQNRVPTGSVDEGFGASAGFIARGASTGIFDLVKQVRRRK